MKTVKTVKSKIKGTYFIIPQSIQYIFQNIVIVCNIINVLQSRPTFLYYCIDYINAVIRVLIISVFF